MANTTLTVSKAMLEELKKEKEALGVKSLEEVVEFLVHDRKTRRGEDWAGKMIARRQNESVHNPHPKPRRKVPAV